MSIEWNGKGLPPVGQNVEWRSDTYGWLGGKVVGHDESVAILRHNDGYAGRHAHNIRPIRTPEQIAAEERDKAIAEMLKPVFVKLEAAGLMTSGAPGILGVAMGALYDNNYRKVTQ